MKLSPLSDFEACVLGVLLERELVCGATSPIARTDLLDACGERCRHAPATQASVDTALQALLARNLVTTDASIAAFHSLLAGRFGFDPSQLAALSLLLLNGAQTAQQLVLAGQKLYPFRDPISVTSLLASLHDHPAGPFVEPIEVDRDAAEPRYRHLFSPAGTQTAVTFKTAETTQHIPTGEDELELRLGELDKVIRNLIPE
ncbi:MAG: DUF480 domain-containing protein [Thiotrichales bacterium]